MRFPPRLTTARTLLRAWQPDDVPALKAALDRNKEHLQPWIPWATGEDTPLETVTARVKAFVDDFAADRNWIYGIFSPDGSSILGGTGLHDRIGPGGLEVGYWIDRGHINRGLGGEVAGALTDLAFGDPAVERVEMHIDARNLASARIPARLGFELAELRQKPERPGSEVEVTMMIWRQGRGRR